MSQLKITLVQSEIHWCNWEANKSMYEQLLAEVSPHTDLIILPEMFSSGFVMQPKHDAQSMHDDAVNWMKAQSINRAICGSLAICDKDQYFNRFIWCENGVVKHYYDKHHLFTYAGENEQYVCGQEKILIEYKGFKIQPFICYDLRFPAWCRSIDDSDLLIFCANWPAKRMHAWNTLLAARAIENVCYTVGVNRIGTDDNKLEYNGQSQVNNWLGETVLYASDSSGIFEFELNKSELEAFRKTFPFLADKDKIEINRDEFSIGEMIDDFF